jgi:hypothetical protein
MLASIHTQQNRSAEGLREECMIFILFNSLTGSSNAQLAEVDGHRFDVSQLPPDPSVYQIARLWLRDAGAETIEYMEDEPVLIYHFYHFNY